MNEEVGIPSPPLPSARPLKGASSGPEREALAALSDALLRAISTKQPEPVRVAIADAKAGLAKHYKDDPADLAAARIHLCFALLDGAPGYGLEEFEAIENDPGLTPKQDLTALRLGAGIAYSDANREAAAAKVLREVLDDKEADDTTRLITYQVLAASLHNSESLELMQKAQPLAEKFGSPMILPIVAARLELGDDAGKMARSFEALAKRPGETRFWTLLEGMCATRVPVSERCALLASGFEALRTHPCRDRDQHILDLLIYSGWALHGCTKVAVAASAEAESLAKLEPPGSRLPQLARLSHAKALKEAGDEMGLKSYQDVDPSKNLDLTLVTDQKGAGETARLDFRIRIGIPDK